MENTMTLYKYCDLDGDHYITDIQIIKEYFPYWSQMMEKVKKKHLISYERCIEDFCVIHWAFKVKEYGK